MESRVSDIMERDVYFVRPDQSVAETMRYMAEKRISGLPIINEDGKLEGFVSDGDLMLYMFKLGQRHDPLFAENLGDLHAEDLNAIGELKAELESEPVMNLATRKVVTVYLDDLYDDACRFLSKKKIKKVPVVDHNQRVVGVLSRSMMVRHLFEYNIRKQLDALS